MQSHVVFALALLGFVGCHDKPEKVAHDYLEKLSQGDLGSAREFVMPECHDTPEGMGTLLSREGFEIRHARIETRVDSADEQVAYVIYDVTGMLNALHGAPSHELNLQQGHENHSAEFNRHATLVLSHGDDGWLVGCSR